uniref:ATP synthase F0 subunit 8 n=1 Tax=Dermanyssus gallinae TaxID=34641 RepID=A0A7U3PY97_9ACAR|nr:ATP synthase F0 subunit 8 [Dermanyssus gallinae]QPG86041.1 ATP synthase F0 subunit 8 [Dermanyssus gallinae]
MSWMYPYMMVLFSIMIYNFYLYFFFLKVKKSYKKSYLMSIRWSKIWPPKMIFKW